VNEIIANPEAAKAVHMAGVDAGSGAAAGAPGAPRAPGSVQILAGPGGSEVLLVPTTLVGFIIGKGGENVRDIQARTGCSVQVQRAEEMAPGEADRRVTLSGTPQTVAAARAVILSMVESRRLDMLRGGGGASAPGDVASALAVVGAAASGTGSRVITMAIPDSQIGMIIGRAGATVKALQLKLGVHINVRRRGGTPRSAPVPAARESSRSRAPARTRISHVRARAPTAAPATASRRSRRRPMRAPSPRCARWRSPARTRRPRPRRTSSTQ